MTSLASITATMNKSNPYRDLDKLSQDGVFSVPSQRKMNMKALLEYCKSNNKKPEQLTDDEIKAFEIK